MSEPLKERFEGFKTEPQKEYDWGEKEYIERLISENSQLRYDLKFMDINYREAVDHMNEFLEKTIQLEKENELLKRENKALADDNEMKCELNDKLSKEVAELKRMMKTFK